MNDVMKMVDDLEKKLNRSKLKSVYQELNNTIIDEYFEKFTVKEIMKKSEDELIDEISDILKQRIAEVPFSLLLKKMNDEDFCLQVAIITKFIQES